jgi:pentapeptide MXKDX repeat protein
MSQSPEGGVMKRIMSSVTVLVAAVLSVGVAAQSNGTMGKGDKMNEMAMKDATYTGCVEAGSEPGSFTLTHLAAEDHMGNDAMKKDAMGKDAMKKDTMAKDSMSKDAMAPMVLSVTGSSVDLGKHLGHKVSVTGSPAHAKMDAMGKDTMAKSAAAFTVKSLRMVAASCS